MGGVYLGINDDKKVIKSRESFFRELSHVARTSNLKNYEYANDDFINIVYDDRDRMKNLLNEYEKNLAANTKSKSEFTNQISRLNYKIKTYEKEISKIEKDLTFVEKGSRNEVKLLKKLQRKEKTLFNALNKRQELTNLRDKALDHRSIYKNVFNELIFDLTSLPKELHRNKKFGSKMLETFGEYIGTKFPNLEVGVIACHLDQDGPHVHINGIYTNGTLTQDLENAFGKDDQLELLQKDFFDFLSKSDLVKDYKLELNDLKSGEVYIPKQELKLIEQQSKNLAAKEIKLLRKEFSFKNLMGKEKIDFEAYSKKLELELRDNIKENLILKARHKLAIQKGFKFKGKANEYKSKLKEQGLEQEKILAPFKSKIQQLEKRNIELIKENASMKNKTQNVANELYKKKSLEDKKVKELVQELKKEKSYSKNLEYKISDLENELEDNQRDR